MSRNKSHTFTLTGGEDAVSSSLKIPDGMARSLYNYTQTYDTGYRRINGYRQLVAGDLPGEGPVRGLTVFNNKIYLFQDKIGGLEGGMWVATPATYRIGNEVDGDSQSLWGVNIQTAPGQWDEIVSILPPRTDIDVPDSPVPANATLAPGGYYEFATHNFQHSVGGNNYIGDYAVLPVHYPISLGDIIEDSGNELGGGAGTLWSAENDHLLKASIDTDDWALMDKTNVAALTSHDVSGDAGLLYGVNGVDRAFEFDDSLSTFGQIAQIDSGYDDDKPHHIATNGNRLVLGFRFGEVAMSVNTGNPHNFNLIYGAGNVIVSDYLTGMVPGVGGDLYVFCKNNTYIISNMDKRYEEVETKKHSQDVGAYPYTGRELASRTFFYDTWGVTELAATDKYGNVAANSISSKVQKLIANSQPVKAVISRADAQYKLYFRLEGGSDDYTTLVLNTTIIENDSLGFSHIEYPFTVDHGCIGEIQDPSGIFDYRSVEEFHVMGVSELNDLDVEVYQVYHMDVGNSFNGAPYLSYMTLPFNYVGSPHEVKKFKKMMMNIGCESESTFNIAADFSFGADNTPKDVLTDTIAPSGSAWHEGDWQEMLWGSGFTSYLLTYLNGLGQNIRITITQNSDRTAPHTLKDITFIYERMRIER